MREFKFRLWDSKQEGMINCPRYSKGIGLVEINSCFKQAQEDGFVIMQFTGLKDRNGKDIFEGDIIKTWSGLIKVVEFRKGEFGAWIMGESLGLNDCEILGNLYQNPELLKKEK